MMDTTKPYKTFDLGLTEMRIYPECMRYGYRTYYRIVEHNKAIRQEKHIANVDCFGQAESFIKGEGKCEFCFNARGVSKNCLWSSVTIIDAQYVSNAIGL